MRMLIVPAAVVALVASGAVADAADITGMIKSIDNQKASLTLDNGKVYDLPSTMKLSSFKVGEKVQLTYSESNGKMEVSAIKPAG